MEKEREGRETPSAGDKDGGKQASWGSEGSAWEAGGGQQTGSPSTPFPVPPPASAAGATGRGAGQAGDCGGAEQPHRGECPLPFPCPGDTPPPGPWHPVGAQAGGAGWAAGPGSGLPGDSGAQTLCGLWAAPEARGTAGLRPGPGPPLLSPAAAAPAAVPPCSPCAPHPSPCWPGGQQRHGAAGPVRSTGRPGSAGCGRQGGPGRWGGRGTQR